MPYITLEKLISWWGYSEPQGVDIKFLGNDPEGARNYVLKYITKNALPNFIEVSHRDNYVRFREFIAYVYIFSVRLIGRSRSLCSKASSSRNGWYFSGIGYVYDFV